MYIQGQKKSEWRQQDNQLGILHWTTWPRDTAGALKQLKWAIQLQKVQSQATISPLRWKMSPRLEGIGEYPDTASGWPLCEALLWAMPSFLSRETWGQRLSICLRSHTAVGWGEQGVLLRPRTSSTSSSHHHHSVSQKSLCISCRNVCIKQCMHLYFFKKTLPICFAEVVPIYILTSTISFNFSWPSQSCFPVWFFQPVKWSVSLPACLLCADEVNIISHSRAREVPPKNCLSAHFAHLST